MFITKSLTKKRLEELIKQSFQLLNHTHASYISDSLKAIGFYYATASGISISLDDLKTPSLKNELMENIENDFKSVSNNWASGLISDIERFQSVIDNWNFGAELLKQKIIEHFQAKDPLNSLYIMAFSGARGNMSQVRQVIGMRGLMVNQEGSIIDLPIKTNFREGLSSIDYIVSSYGARKGVVDTALKTADAGYLTRRLIFVAQEITIKAIDCKTSSFQSFFLTQTTVTKDLLGKVYVKASNVQGEDIFLFDKNSKIYLTEANLQSIKKKFPLILFYRSPLTCKIKNGICQTCYGWDLTRSEKIDLGLAVGILAAQSIGEPGTQLTMRTFHTGGIFTGQFIEHQTAPFSGKLEMPQNIKTCIVKNLHGKSIPLLLEDIVATITSLEGKKAFLTFSRLSFLHILKSGFVKKNQILSELRQELKLIPDKKQHPLRAPFDSFLNHKQFSIRSTNLNKFKITKNNSKIRLSSGQLYETSLNSKYLVKNFLNKNSAFAYSKIITPIGGILVVDPLKQIMQISTNLTRALLNISQLTNLYKIGKIEKVIKNFSFIDPYSIIGYYYYYPQINAKIYRLKQTNKITNSLTSLFFFITEKDIWQIFYESPRLFKNKSKIIFPGDFLTENNNSSSSGVCIKINGLHQIYHKSIDICLPQGALVNSFQKQFFKQNEILAHVLLSKQKGDDIVQGLPKIEELLEARRTKKRALLFSVPSIFLGNWEIFKLQSKLKVLKESKLNTNKYNIYSVECYPQNEIFFKLASKVKKVTLNHNDRRSVKRAQSKTYFRLNFFQTPLSSKIFTNFKNISYKKNLFKKFDSFLNENKILQPTKIKNSIFCIYDQYKNKTFNLLSLSLPYIRFPIFPIYKKNSNFNVRQIFKEFSTDIAQTLFLKLAEKRKTSTFYSTKNLDLIQNNISLKEKIEKLDWYSLETLNLNYEHYLVQPSKIKIRISEFIEVGRAINEGKIDPHQVLLNLFYYQYLYDNLIQGVIKSIGKFQLILLNSIQSVYRSQGVEIANIHIELIVRELTSKVKIKFNHSKVFFSNEILSLQCASKIAEIYATQNRNELFYEPILFPISKISLQKEGFLAAASFQETRTVLAKAAIEGKKDWIKGLKESIIIGRSIPAGTGFLNSKNYLDNIYYYKNI